MSNCEGLGLLALCKRQRRHSVSLTLVGFFSFVSACLYSRSHSMFSAFFLLSRFLPLLFVYSLTVVIPFHRFFVIFLSQSCPSFRHFLFVRVPFCDSLCLSFCVPSHHFLWLFFPHRYCYSCSCRHDGDSNNK